MRTTAAAPALLALVALALAGCGGDSSVAGATLRTADSDLGGITEAPDSSDAPRDDPGYSY